MDSYDKLALLGIVFFWVFGLGLALAITILNRWENALTLFLAAVVVAMSGTLAMYKWWREKKKQNIL